MCNKEIVNHIVSAFIAFILLLIFAYHSRCYNNITLQDIKYCLIFSLIAFIPLLVSKLSLSTALLEKHVKTMIFLPAMFIMAIPLLEKGNIGYGIFASTGLALLTYLFFIRPGKDNKS